MSLTVDTSRTTQLRRRVFQIERLSAMPQVVMQVVEALGDHRTSAAGLEKLIESDPALASKVLRLANSVYYGLAEKVTTIQRAITVIGFNELEILVVGAGLADIFDPSKVIPGSDAEMLWHHSLAVACTARILAEATRHPAPNEIMLAGLLHDIGKLILNNYFDDDVTELKKVVDRGTPYYMAEEMLDLKHTTIGFWLANRWNLPAIHTSTIRYHHAPNPLDPHYPTTVLIMLADYLVKQMNIGVVHAEKPFDPGEIANVVNMSMEDLRQVRDRAKRTVPPFIERWRALL
jgi:putative nucleotidyltransferase with HDIG domain